MAENGISGEKQFRDYTKSKIKVFTFLNKYYMLLSYFTYLFLLKNHLHDCILTLKSRKIQTSELKIPSPGGVRIEAHANKSQGVYKMKLGHFLGCAAAIALAITVFAQAPAAPAGAGAGNGGAPAMGGFGGGMGGFGGGMGGFGGGAPAGGPGAGGR